MRLYKIVIFITLLNFSCKNSSDKYLGVWNVKDNFHEAIYEIEKCNDKYNVKVLEYFDGTTKIDSSSSTLIYKYKNLVKNDEYELIDMYSGETNLTKEHKIKLSIKHNDTIIVSELINNKINNELWVKDITKNYGLK
ncbi:hypothetical protein [Aureivirga marina]|uniref:hypothetical protein n=1 Tax=Aureivirga marina TaxID=1182451 RepID=UPI0018C9A1A4|nr:hypothetical protein [Aureivirga marina]